MTCMSAQREAAAAKAARRPAPSLAAPHVYPSFSQLSSAVQVPKTAAASAPAAGAAGSTTFFAGLASVQSAVAG